jgi:hypothetical protein
VHPKEINENKQIEINAQTNGRQHNHQQIVVVLSKYKSNHPAGRELYEGIDCEGSHGKHGTALVPTEQRDEEIDRRTESHTKRLVSFVTTRSAIGAQHTH